MGYDRKYTRQLKTFRDKWWEFDRHGNPISKKKSKHKSWRDFEYYQTNKPAAIRRTIWESGERDFTKVMERLHGRRHSVSKRKQNKRK